MGILGKPATWSRRKRKPSSSRPKIVCAGCNNGWMGNLEQRALPLVAPMLRGEAIELGADAQGVVAFWVVKTALTARWVHRSSEYLGIPESHYREVHAEQRPPLTAQVWIAVCSHDDRPPDLPPIGFRYVMTRLERFEASTDAGVVLPLRPAWAVAMSLGNLASLTFAHTYDAISAGIRFDGLLGRALHPVWPVQSEALSWPSGYCLNYPEFDMLTQRLERWR